MDTCTRPSDEEGKRQNIMHVMGVAPILRCVSITISQFILSPGLQLHRSGRCVSLVPRPNPQLHVSTTFDPTMICDHRLGTRPCAVRTRSRKGHG